MIPSADTIPLVSIIIATYNAGSHLKKCLQSILSYAPVNAEIIIVDGLSTDNTINILKDFETLNLKWITEADNGIYDALNKGVKMATGSWIHFLGSDDQLLPGFSHLCKELIDFTTVYYANSQPFYDGINQPTYDLLYGEFDKYRIAKYCINHQAILYPSLVFKQYQYNTRYKVFADYALNIQLWGNDNFPKQYLPLTIVLYNMTGFSSVKKDAAFIQDKPALIKQSMGASIFLKYMLKRFKNRFKGKTDML